jgi:hypothetical protein
MSDNDRVLLDGELNDFKRIHKDFRDDSHLFEFFAATQILKGQEDVDEDEIRDGLLREESGSGGNDGGVDALYAFVESSLVREDTKPTNPRNGAAITLYIIQSKWSKSFSQNSVLALRKTIEELFDLDLDFRSVRTRYNRPLIAKMRKIQSILKSARRARYRFRFYYVTKGDDEHENVRNAAEDVKRAAKEHFGSADVEFEFIGAAKLLDILRRPEETTECLRFVEAVETPDRKGFIGFVNLVDYFRLISTKDGSLRGPMFEANVRDYQGSNEVNNAIRETLNSNDPKGEDFWALNNGITIVADEADRKGRQFEMKNPSVVNGMQTSKEIQAYFASHGTDDDERLILVRIVVPKSAKGRDRIIFSTNSQTKIPRANLHATEDFQRDIEEFFSRHNYFYDRRKGYYRQQGRALDRIFSILSVAQAVMSIIFGTPSIARARPSTLVAKDAMYKRIFDRKRDLDAYLVCAMILKQCQHHLRSIDIPQKEKNNIKFHTALCYAMAKTGESPVDPKSLKLSEFQKVDAQLMERSVTAVRQAFANLQRKHSDKTEDQLAKSPAFDESVIRSAKRAFHIRST